MPFQGVQGSTGVRIGKLDHSILIAGGDDFAIRSDRYGKHRPAVGEEVAEQHNVVPVRDGEPAVRNEGERVDRMPNQHRTQQFATFDRPELHSAGLGDLAAALKLDARGERLAIPRKGDGMHDSVVVGQNVLHLAVLGTPQAHRFVRTSRSQDQTVGRKGQ